MVLTNPKVAILFVHYGDNWIRGSERCLLDLLGHLDQQQFTPIVWCNSEIMAEQIKALEITCYCQPFPLLFGWHTPRFNFSGFFNLIKHGTRFVDRYNIKLIHSNSGAPCQWLNIVARRRQLPLVAHLHCRYPLRDRITFGLHHVSQLLAVSHPVSKQYLNDSINKNRVAVVSNGIDKQRLNVRNTINIRKLLGLSATDLVLFSAGSLIHTKGVDLLIDALLLLRKNAVPAKLVIAGDGPYKEQLQHQIAHLKLKDDVFLLGERSDLGDLLQGGVDIFVSGAREEAFGLVLAEAGLHKLPVIAPAVGGIVEVIQHNHTGLLVPPQQPLHIARAVELLYQQPQLRIRLGLAANKRIERLFLIEKNVHTIESFYLKMLSNRNYSLTWTSHWSANALIKSIIQFLLKKLVNKLIYKRKYNGNL